LAVRILLSLLLLLLQVCPLHALPYEQQLQVKAGRVESALTHITQAVSG
jgi:hypothetical protein